MLIETKLAENFVISAPIFCILQIRTLCNVNQQNEHFLN